MNRPTIHRSPGVVYAIRNSNWQLDYRPTGYLPFSVRYGKRKPEWRVLRLGRLGCITLGPLIRLETQ